MDIPIDWRSSNSETVAAIAMAQLRYWKLRCCYSYFHSLVVVAVAAVVVVAGGLAAVPQSHHRAAD